MIEALRAVKDIERAILLEADPELLPVYADALEESGFDPPWQWAGVGVRNIYLTSQARLAAEHHESGAEEVRRHGWASLPADCIRLAYACLLDATHPAESAELRLSVLEGARPAECYLQDGVGNERLKAPFAYRLPPGYAGGQTPVVVWYASPHLQPGDGICAWRWDSLVGWAVHDPRTAQRMTLQEAGAAVRRAARRHIEEALRLKEEVSRG